MQPILLFLVRLFRWTMAALAVVVIAWAFTDVGTRLIGDRDHRRVELTLLQWGNTQEEGIVIELIREFERLHPDIRVRRLHSNDYNTKLKTMLAGGTPPDLFYLGYDHVPTFASLDLVYDLEPLLAGDPEAQAWLSDFYPVLVNTFRWKGDTKAVGGGGHLLGVPKDFTPILMYINVDLFDAAGIAVPYDGWTWSEYREAMRRIRALSKDAPERFAGVYGGVLHTGTFNLRNIAWTFGGAFFGGADESDFRHLRLTDPATIESMDLIRTLRFDDRSVVNTTGIGQSESDLFLQGKIGAIGPVGRWMTPKYRLIDNFRWDVVPLPHKQGVPPASAIATVAWSISADTQHPAEAYELLKFLTGEAGQRLSSELGLAVPSMRSVAESDAFLEPGKPPAHARLFLDLIP